jgi:bifunctional DNA-binding transcriptional regulator/antitoxin component of YhaV-PrlF toxin-antitoxin module
VKIRRHLGVGVGDKVAFTVEEDGTVKVRPVKYPTIASLQGAAGSLPRRLSWAEMREIAYEDRLGRKLGDAR